MIERGRIRQLVLGATGLIITLVVCELFIRASHLGSVSINNFYEDIGIGYRKNHTYVYFNEGFGIGKVNENRFLGNTIPKIKEKETTRFILLGDSYIESFQILQRNYFGRYLEKNLKNKHPNKKFEVLNFGRSGFDITDMYTYQKVLAESFKPNYILYFISKDDLEPSISNPYRPELVSGSDRLKITFNYNEKAINNYKKVNFLTRHSSLINMANSVRKNLNHEHIGAILFDKFYIIHENKTDNVYPDKIIEKPLKPIVYEIFEELDSNKVIIVNRDKEKLPEVFVNLCIEKGFKIIDLSNLLLQLEAKGKNPNYWGVTGEMGHWNTNAHKEIGLGLATKIGMMVEFEKSGN